MRLTLQLKQLLLTDIPAVEIPLEVSPTSQWPGYRTLGACVVPPYGATGLPQQLCPTGPAWEARPCTGRSIAQDQGCLPGTVLSSWAVARGPGGGWAEMAVPTVGSAGRSFLKGPGSVIEGPGLCFGSPGRCRFLETTLLLTWTKLDFCRLTLHSLPGTTITSPCLCLGASDC